MSLCNAFYLIFLKVCHIHENPLNFQDRLAILFSIILVYIFTFCLLLFTLLSFILSTYINMVYYFHIKNIWFGVRCLASGIARTKAKGAYKDGKKIKYRILILKIKPDCHRLTMMLNLIAFITWLLSKLYQAKFLKQLTKFYNFAINFSLAFENSSAVKTPLICKSFSFEILLAMDTLDPESKVSPSSF